MRKSTKMKSLIWLNTMVLLTTMLIAIIGSNAVTTAAERQVLTPHRIVVIDAGHGGIDGGATSCTGVLESQINLDIAVRLNDLLHLLGIHTVMTRTDENSLHTEGNSIASQKVSDLRNRVKIINKIPNAVLISIHQNHFSDQRYSGAQVFYATTTESAELAKELQTLFVKTLNPNSNRQIKKASGIYLMKNINCPGVLIECGFISNPVEENKLLSPVYQKKICCVIAATLSLKIKQIT